MYDGRNLFDKKKVIVKYQFSYWEKESFLKNIDVAIIGSGIVGLAAAIHLKKSSPKLNVVVLERGALPIGASTRNAGFACIGSMTEILDDLKGMNEEEVFDLVEMRYRGLNLMRETLGDSNIGYQKCGGYEIFSEDETDTFEYCVSEMQHFNQLMKDITGLSETFQVIKNRSSILPKNSFKHLIVNKVEGSLHTGEMMKSWLKLAREEGVKLLCGVNITQVKDDGAEVILELDEHKSIKAKKVVIATNGMAKELINLKDIQPARNQVIVTSVIPGLKLNGTFHYQKGYVYFRNIDQRVLIGGFRHISKTEEKTSNFGSTAIIQKALLEFLESKLLRGVNFNIEHKWSGIMGVGKTKKPIINQTTQNCFVAVRLGGMGVAIGALVGKEVAEVVLNN